MITGTIAIIIPVYNTAAYLADCLDSLLAQTYPHWVAYCVDDGSKDDSLRMLERYAERDRRIKVFHKKNGGVSSARNYALKHLCGEEWLSFLDSDDYLSPNMYENIMRVIKRYNSVNYVSLSCCKTLRRYEEQLQDEWSGNQSDDACDVQCLTYEKFFLDDGNSGFMADLFVRSSVVIDNGIFFYEDMEYMEDQVFSMTCAIYSGNVIWLKSHRDYFYFFGNENSSARVRRNASDDIIRCVNRVYYLFMRRCSPAFLKDYYLKRYLPIKIDFLFSSIYRCQGKKPSEKIDRRISVPICSLSLKRLIKYVVIKMVDL